MKKFLFSFSLCLYKYLSFSWWNPEQTFLLWFVGAEWSVISEACLCSWSSLSVSPWRRTVCCYDTGSLRVSESTDSTEPGNRTVCVCQVFVYARMCVLWDWGWLKVTSFLCWGANVKHPVLTRGLSPGRASLFGNIFVLVTSCVFLRKFKSGLSTLLLVVFMTFLFFFFFF